MSADKQFRVTIDGRQVYEFGVNDSRPFGKTPGSVTNFIDIPENLKEGIIEIEMTSPYDNYASNITGITISKRDTSILNLLKSNLGNFAMCIIILACGITLFMLAFISGIFKTDKRRYKLPWLYVYFRYDLLLNRNKITECFLWKPDALLKSCVPRTYALACLYADVLH